MSVLIGKETTKALKDKKIRIEPLDKSQIGPGSIDLTLGNDFRVFKKQSKIYHVRNHSDFQDITLAVHVNAGFMHPGISNHQVLEIVNLGHGPLALYPGTRICQFVFEKCQGRA